MKLGGMTFPEAVAYLTGGPAPSRQPRPRPRPAPRPAARPEAGRPARGDDPRGRRPGLVAEAAARLWSPEGADALAYLTGPAAA